MGTLITIVLFVVVLGLLVCAHELGHFFAAKRSGVRVDEFGFGFPPRIFGKRFRGTLYSLNWIPLGGFVKIKGVAGDDSEPISNTDSDSFAAQPFLRKFLILFAGIGMNVVVAVILFALSFAWGFDATPDTLNSGAITSDSRIVVSQVLAESPAATAGIQPGDVIRQYADEAQVTVPRLQEFFAAHANTVVPLTVQRGEEAPYEVKVTPEQIVRDTQVFVGIGVGLEELVHVRYPWYQALWLGGKTTVLTIGEIFVSLGTLIKTLFVEKSVPQGLAGPVGIAVMTKQVADMGFVYLLQFAALLSVNLAVFNFLPIPALDGGRIAFVLIEKIQRKPVSQRVEATIHTIGFALLLLLIGVVTWKDIVRL